METGRPYKRGLVDTLVCITSDVALRHPHSWATESRYQIFGKGGRDPSRSLRQTQTYHVFTITCPCIYFLATGVVFFTTGFLGTYVYSCTGQ